MGKMKYQARAPEEIKFELPYGKQVESKKREERKKQLEVKELVYTKVQWFSFGGLVKTYISEPHPKSYVSAGLSQGP